MGGKKRAFAVVYNLCYVWLLRNFRTNSLFLFLFLFYRLYLLYVLKFW